MREIDEDGWDRHVADIVRWKTGNCRYPSSSSEDEEEAKVARWLTEQNRLRLKGLMREKRQRKFEKALGLEYLEGLKKNSCRRGKIEQRLDQWLDDREVESLIRIGKRCL